MSSRMGPRGAFLGTGPQQYQPAPNAALLIDFDNVTMSIRSDLGKEIKALLKSEVIRGKVAVQRAYADWRRYPQYIVPLTESSVDLIFAPAYGSAKKNATDLRMAIDAIELVFTRPEIGTFILMTGDSDFSSCVLKLKEYGKYVIGVGMRESSSDLLIQNCDEYYSYHSISGLTRAGEIEESKEDPWVLVRRAVQQMVKNGDVMRTDRLKQVMLDLDAGFDEKKVGYTKFSRFVSEAASKGILHLRKTENGQYEILPEGPAQPEPREKVVERIVAEAEAGANGRRRGRGRGRDDRPREPRPRPEAPARIDEAPTPEGALAEPTPVTPEETGLEATPAGGPVGEAPVREEVARGEPAAAEPAQTDGALPLDLATAYGLLQEALRRLTGRDGKPVRDGDVKRKMLEISRDFDETQLGFSKFTRFLRQAHDAEVIDLNRIGAGNYEVALPASGKRLPAPSGQRPGIRAEDASAKRREAESAASGAAAAPAAEPGVAPTERPPARRDAIVPEVPLEAPPAARPAEQRAALSPTEPAPTPPSMGALRGRRGGRPLSGPPPILPGQAIPSPLRSEDAERGPAGRSTAAASAGPGGSSAPDEPAAPLEMPVETAEQVRPDSGAEAPVSETAPQPEQEEVSSVRGRGRSRRGRRGRSGREARDEAGTGAGAESEAAGARDAKSEPVAEEAATPAAATEAPGGEETAEARPARGRRGRRGRGRSDAAAGSDELAASATPQPTSGAAEPLAEAPEQAATAGPAVTAEAPAPDAPEEPRRTGTGARRGRRGGVRGEGAPPPILEGQIGRRAETAPTPEAPPVEPSARGIPAAPASAPKPRVPSRSGRGKKTGATTGAAGGRAFSAADLGLPRDPAEITSYLSSSYKGIGKKTAETLLERFGPDLFRVMQERPAEIRAALDDRRAVGLLEQWQEDYARRSASLAAETAPRSRGRGGRATPRKESAAKA